MKMAQSCSDNGGLTILHIEGLAYIYALHYNLKIIYNLQLIQH